MGKIIEGNEFKTAGLIRKFLISKKIIPGALATTSQVKTLIELHELEKNLFKENNFDKYNYLKEDFKSKVDYDLFICCIGEQHPVCNKYLYVID